MWSIGDYHCSFLSNSLTAPCSHYITLPLCCAVLSFSSSNRFWHERTSDLSGSDVSLTLWINAFVLNTSDTASSVSRWYTLPNYKGNLYQLSSLRFHQQAEPGTFIWTHSYTPFPGWWCALVCVPHSLASFRWGCWVLLSPGQWGSGTPTVSQQLWPLRIPVPSGWRVCMSCSGHWASSASALFLCWLITVER